MFYFAIFLLIIICVGTIYFWVFARQLRAAAYADRSKQMIRLQITLPKKESSAEKEKEVTHDYKETLGTAEQLFATLHGIYNKGLIKSMKEGQDYFGFEIAVANTASRKGKSDSKPLVEFFLLTLPKYRTLLERQIIAFYPDANVEEVKDFSIFAEGTSVKSAALTQRSNKFLPLKTYTSIQQDPANALINALGQVNPGEGLAIQILFQSAGNSWVTKANTAIKNLQAGKGETGDSFLSALQTKSPNQPAPTASPLDQEKAKAISEKVKKAGFECKIRVVSVAADPTSAEAALQSITAAFSEYEDPQLNALVPQYKHDEKITESYREVSFDKNGSKLLLNSEEIVSLVHFPDHRFNQSDSINWLSFRKVGAPPNVPQEGIELGFNDFHAKQTPIRIKRNDRTRHFYCIGKSGSGKSTLLEYMIKQDIKNGEGVCVIDPHGDLAEAIIPYIPKERAKDVIYFNPGDIERPVGLNLLEAPPDKHDFITGQALGIFIKLFGEEIFGPRLQHYVRNGCLTLMDDDEWGGTLIEIPRLFIDPEFQKRKVAKVKNPVVRTFWEKEMANTGEKEKQEMIPYLTSKFGQFITDSTIRNIIGQQKSGLDMRKAMDEQKIVLVNLAKGVIGEQNMQLLGMILITKIQMAAMGRFDMKAEDRKDFYLYVDEFQNFATDAFGSILSEARKYRLNLIVAHQYIKQLKDEIRDAVFGNVGTMMCFKVGADDAEHMAKEYAPVYGEQDIVNIPNYKAYIKLCIDNATSTAFSMNTVYDKTGCNDELGNKIKELARMKLGKPREFVDKETRERAGGG